MSELRIQYMVVDDLPPNPLNPKGHSIEDIDASMTRFGYVDPVVIDERTGKLLSGHGRREALMARKDRGEPPPLNVEVDAEGRWLAPVVRGVRTTSDIEAGALIVGVNELVAAGGWDPDRLAPLLESIRVESSLVGTGFTNEGLDELLAELALQRDDGSDAGGGSASDEGDRPAPPRVVEAGDLWMLGRHRLLCGDSRNAEHVDRLLDGAVVNVAFTSPPYADRRKYDETTEFRPIPPEEYVDWFAPVAANVAAHLADDGSWFVNIKPGADGGQRLLYVYDLVQAHVRDWGWRWVDEFCWVDASNGVPGAWSNRFKDAWEPVHHFARQSAIKFRPLANGTWSEDVFDYDASKAKSNTGSGLLGEKADAHGGIARPSNVLRMATSRTPNHPAAFPVGLPAWFVRAYSDPGDTVLDAFAGSGSTLLAAEQECRVGFGMELSPTYCDVICARFQRVTGVKPVRDGEPVDFLAQR